ncbi:hypothetical protein F5Y09DRAFT_344098 [Xylaria sp. FL1042]|nr:hypothetical protein F5Y09DRAFT_344098 [Xylaria sp. FL1042]
MTDRAADSLPRAPGPKRGGGNGPLLEAEKSARSAPASSDQILPSPPSESTATITAAATATAAPKRLRSCVVCRSRKVRCNKESPCSNCRRAGIPCVVPSADRPPRWARRLERFAHNAAAEERSAQAAAAAAAPTAELMERLRNLENLVKELNTQLEQAHALSNSSTGNSPASSTNDRDSDHQAAASLTSGGSSIHSQFGRLVLNDAGRSRYVSSGFWSRVNDEIDSIKMETQHLAEAELDSTEDEDPPGVSASTHDLERTASERHAFLFGHNLNPPGPDFRELHPLPSQVPFLLDVFAENVNFIVQIVHMPTIRKMARRSRRNDSISASPSQEALMFSIYYAAIASMEDDDVVSNFGSTKTELASKYRLGLEHALARADFLNKPDLVLVQAFSIFLFLVRLHESPRFIWMMTGLVIRMAQSLGLQRDGTHFKHLTPYEVDMRRRVWYALCSLDVRASEDQGTDFTIQPGSFDTKLPLNINSDDIAVDTKQTPAEREGITDMTGAIVQTQISNISRRVVSPSVGLEEQSRLIGSIYTTLEERYLRFSTESENIQSWVIVVVTRLVVAKLTLFTHLPVLFSSPGEHFSQEIRNKLLIAAIEVAEFNHALNAEKASHQWRWVYQTYTHWHAVVYLLIEICRRPWSPIIERSWTALHSPWLIPAKSKLNKDMRTWVPLRKLMLKARKHRDDELERLRHDPSAARQLEIDDRELPVPSTVGSVSASAAADIFRGRWRRLVGISGIPNQNTEIEKQTLLPSFEPTSPLENLGNSSGLGLNATPTTVADSQSFFLSTDPVAMPETMSFTTPDAMALDQSFNNEPQHNAFSHTTIDWSEGHPESGGLLSWFWADADPTKDVFADVDMGPMDLTVDFDETIDWHNWVESAKGMEMDAQTNADR